MILRAIYETAYNFFGRSDFLTAVVGCNIVHGVALWGTNCFFISADLTGKPEWMRKYKIQPNTNFPVPFKKWWKTFNVVMFNWLVWNTLVFTGLYFLWKKVGCSFRPEDVPSLPTIIWHIAVTNILDEITFYWVHRLMHVPIMYKYFHKKHHEWPAPIGMVVFYAGVVEHSIVNILSISTGTVLMRSHILTTWIWYLAGISLATVGHSGYHLPFFISPRFHDFHHARFDTNYGNAGWLDNINGTSHLFNKNKQNSLHNIFFGPTNPGEAEQPAVQDSKDK